MNSKKRIVYAVLSAIFTCAVLPLPAFSQPDPKDFSQANKLFSAGKYTDALRIYETLQTSRPPDVPQGLLYTRIGDSYFQLTDYRKAVDAYRRSLLYQKPEEMPQTRYWIGFSLFLLGKNKEASAEFLKIPEQHPASGRWVTTAYYWAGRANERMGNKDKAAAYYKKAGGRGKATQEQFALKRAEAVGKGK